jgi:hypothetical protein
MVMEKKDSKKKTGVNSERSQENTFIPSDLDEEISQTSEKDMNWFLEEYTERFSDIIAKLNSKIENQCYENATRLIPYFLKALNDKNPSVQKIGLDGLKFIEQEYPELFKKDLFFEV